MNTFKDRLKLILKEKSITQSELSKRSGIGRNSISDYINGKYEAKSDKISVIAKTLNVNEKWLMGYDVPKESDETVVLRVGNILLKELKESTGILPVTFEGIEYLQSLNLIDNTLYKAVYKILSMHSNDEITPHDLIKEKINPVDIIYFEEVIIEEYIRYAKTNRNFILGNISKIKNLINDENFNKYYSEHRIKAVINENESPKHLNINIYEKNLDIELIDEIRSIIFDAKNKIEELEKKYPKMQSQKIAECFIHDFKEYQALGSFEVPDSIFMDNQKTLDYLLLQLKNKHQNVNFDNIEPIHREEKEDIINIKNDGD